MKSKIFSVLIAILVIAGMLMGGIGIAFAEPNYVLSGRDKVGTFGKDGKSARSGFLNTITFEGTTYDTNKTVLSPVDPTGSNVILLQDASGTIAFTGASPIGATLTDTKILVGNSAGLAAEQGLSLINDITGTMDNSGTINATIADDAVGVAEANTNTVTLLIAAGATTNAVTVDSTHKLMSWYITTIGGINGANLINAPAYDGSGGWSISMVNALSADSVYTFEFLKTN